LPGRSAPGLEGGACLRAAHTLTGGYAIKHPRVARSRRGHCEGLEVVGRSTGRNR
jgi:hypothetical protein